MKVEILVDGKSFDVRMFQKGDFLVVRTPKLMTDCELRSCAEGLEKYWDESEITTPLIILPVYVWIEKLDDAELEKIGLRRI